MSKQTMRALWAMYREAQWRGGDIRGIRRALRKAIHKGRAHA